MESKCRLWNDLRIVSEAFRILVIVKRFRIANCRGVYQIKIVFVGIGKIILRLRGFDSKNFPSLVTALFHVNSLDDRRGCFLSLLIG